MSLLLFFFLKICLSVCRPVSLSCSSHDNCSNNDDDDDDDDDENNDNDNNILKK